MDVEFEFRDGGLLRHVVKIVISTFTAPVIVAQTDEGSKSALPNLH
jgi:hypothetical protein